MTDIQTTWTDEQGETWVPFSDYMHLKAALKTERNKALREAAELAYVLVMGPSGPYNGAEVKGAILALITDDQPAPEIMTLWGFHNGGQGWEFEEYPDPNYNTHKITGTIEPIEKE